MTVSNVQFDVIETRSEVNGITLFFNIEDVLIAISRDPTIWKISFTDMNSGERYRLIRFKTKQKEVWVQNLPHNYLQNDMLYAPEREFSKNELLELFIS